MNTNQLIQHKMKGIHLFKLLSILFFLPCFLSCKKNSSENMSPDKAVANINFYNASDVLFNLNIDIPIYMDQFRPKPLPNYPLINPYPYIRTGQKEYPISPSTGYGGNTSIYYTHFEAEEYRFMVSDTAKTEKRSLLFAENRFNLDANSYTCLYVADALTPPNESVNFKIIAVPEVRNVPNDKVGVRFVHLSPDAGSVTCSRQEKDGDALIDVLPLPLDYGTFSPYLYFSQKEASKDQIRFKIHNNKGTELITGINFKPGHSYVIVVTGFLNSFDALIPSGRNLDGSIKYIKSVVYKNLRAEVRTSQ